MQPLIKRKQRKFREKNLEFVKTCDELVIGWYPGKLPPYQVKFTTAPEPVVNVKTPATTPAAKGQINSE